MASRKLTDLHPKLLPLAQDFLTACDLVDIEVLVTCTYRSSAEQDELYKQGRTMPGKRVTNVRGGRSAHNFTIKGTPASKAFDIVPIRNGKLIWDAADPLWQRVGLIATNLGIDWGGNWTTFIDKPHFQLKE